MSLAFIDSEQVEIDGKRLIYFREALTLFNGIRKVIDSVGSQGFFSNPGEKVKKAREGLAALFLLLSFQKETKRNWYLMQPQDDPPDFYLMNVTDNPVNISLEPFELVEIPPMCQTFEEMKKIVEKKLAKGYPPTFNLVIFVNHERSTDWLSELEKNRLDFSAFKAVWATYLLWIKRDKDIWVPVVRRLHPLPVFQITAMLAECQWSYSSEVPTFAEVIEKDGKKFLNMKPSFLKNLRLKLRELKKGV